MAKLNGKVIIGPDQPGAVSAYDEKFSQSGEAVDHGKPDPGCALIEKEGAALLEELESAARVLSDLVGADREKDEMAIDSAERRYERAMAAWTEFREDGPSMGELQSGAADRFEGEGLCFQPESMADYMSRDLASGELLDEERRALIAEAWFRFLGFIFDGWNCNIGQGFKHLLATVRRSNPQYLAEQGLSQQEVAYILGETKASVSTREIKKVEQKLAAAGMKGVRLQGNTKTDTTRENCRRAQRGNSNRSTGTRRKQAFRK